MTGTQHRPTLQIEFTDVNARQQSTPHAVWFATDVQHASERALQQLLAGTGDPVEFCRSNRNALVIRVDLHEGQARRFGAWRGLLSTSEMYYTTRRDGSLFISDHFKNAIALVPPAERHPSDLALVEHYLFRKPTGDRSYSAAIHRMSHGDELTIDLSSGERSLRRFDTLAEPVISRSRDEYLDLVDEQISRAVVPDDSKGSSAVMFSGGVDSSLLMTYLKGIATPLTFVPDTPEYVTETEYARSAAGQIGVSPVEMPMVEKDFLSMLERVTDVAGIPIFDDAKPYLARVILDSPYSQLVPGQGADTTFGTSLRLTRFASWFRWPGVFPMVRAGSRYASGHLGYRLGQIVPRAAGFRQQPLDPWGYAGTTRAHGDTTLFRELAEPELLEQAHALPLAYVAERIERRAKPRSRFFSHLELSHWLLTFGNPVGTDRSVAQSCGKSLVLPYVDAGVLTATATIPVEHRYVRGLTAKWILKGLLQRRVPAYPINQRKQATALPWERFYTAGPLQGIWDRYDVPEVFQGKQKDELVASTSAATWNAISHAVWLERVARNTALEGHPSHLAASYSIADGAVDGARS